MIYRNPCSNQEKVIATKKLSARTNYIRDKDGNYVNFATFIFDETRN